MDISRHRLDFIFKGEMMRSTVLAILISFYLIQGCAPLPSATVQGDRPQGFPFDSVKLINPGIQRNDDPSTYGQSQYTVSEDSRLLLRYGGLRSHIGSVRYTDGKKVEASVTLLDERQLKIGQSVLKICPLIHNWMMRATWDHAYPYNSEGQWGSPGGDFNEDGCVKVSRVEQQTLYFDLTQWFLYFPKGRGQNFGLILVSDQPIMIYGDLSSYSAPKLHWIE